MESGEACGSPLGMRRAGSCGLKLSQCVRLLGSHSLDSVLLFLYNLILADYLLNLSNQRKCTLAVIQ